MKKTNQNGQALIELIIFLPLMFMFYSMIAGFANAINGSINQQKVTRAYFYYRVQNNGNVPKPTQTNDHLRWNVFGMYFVGWMDKFAQGNSGTPMAPCYQITAPLGNASTDTCDQGYSKPTTHFIRVQTVYGICGATYMKQDQDVISIPDGRGTNYQTLNRHTEGCVLDG